MNFENRVYVARWTVLMHKHSFVVVPLARHTCTQPLEQECSFDSEIIHCFCHSLSGRGYYPSTFRPSCTAVFGGKRSMRSEKDAFQEVVEYLWSMHTVETGSSYFDHHDFTKQALFHSVHTTRHSTKINMSYASVG